MFRGSTLQPCDMFDIAAASMALGEDALVSSLLPFAEESKAALDIARRMNPELARTVMGKLMARPGHRDLHMVAQGIACRVLERIVSEAA